MKRYLQWRVPHCVVCAHGCMRPLMHTHILQTSPNYLPGTFWWTTGGNNRASCHQATGCRQRAGQAMTSLSFIHLLIQSFLLPTGKALVGMCPQAQAQCLFLVLRVFQSSTGHKERPRWKPLALPPLASPQRQLLPASKVLLATQKQGWPEAATPMLDCGRMSHFPFSTCPRMSLVILHSCR